MEDLMFIWGSGRIEDVPVDWVNKKPHGKFNSAPVAYTEVSNARTLPNDGHSRWGKTLMHDTCKDDPQHWAIYQMGSGSSESY